MTTDPDFTDHEPEHAASATSTLLDELALYGYRPFQDEPDHRPLPEASLVTGAIADIFDALVSTLQDTRLEPDLEDLLWSTVNVFHRATGRIERELDDNEQAQKRGQREQDGSEVKSVELERHLAEGLTLIERRNAFELMRDLAAEHFQVHTRNAWHPRTGSMVNRKHLTATMIDSRDFLMARRRAETEVLLPAGPKIGFTGGYECNDVQGDLGRARSGQRQASRHGVAARWQRPKAPSVSPSCWADNRKVPQIAFKPDFNRHKNAAPFKRNDVLLETFCRSGSWCSLARASPTTSPTRHRKLGIPLFDFRSKGGGA